MKVTHKLLALFLALPILAGVVSCKESEADYSPAEQLTNAQVYFSSEAPAKIQLSSDTTACALPIYRQNTNGELVLPVSATSSSASVQVSDTVIFAAGKDSSAVVITYDPSKIVVGQYDTITVSFNEKYGTPYAPSKVTVLVGQDEPYAMITKDPDGNKLSKEWYAYDDDDNIIGSYCTYRDDIITGLFGVENYEYKLLIEENQTTKGVYRILNPYGEAYPANEDGDYDPDAETYMVINASDPEAVYIEKYISTTDWSYGYIGAWSLANYYMEKQGMTLEQIKADPELSQYLGKLEDGIITFPEGSLLLNLAEYKDGAWYGANASGLFRVALPGVVLADYSAEVTYAGIFNSVADSTVYAVADVAIGEDVSAGKLYLVSADLKTLYGEKEISASGEYRIAIPDSVSGKLYLLLTVMDADENIVGSSSVLFKYSPSTAEETWTRVCGGVYNYGLSSEGVDDDEYEANYWKYGLWFYGEDDEAVLYQSDSEPTRYKVEPWGYGSLIFTYADGEVTVSDESDYGELEGYGNFYGNEASLYSEAYGMDIEQSSFDEENQVFHFNVAYITNETLYPWIAESFTLVFDEEEAGVRNSRFSPRKTVKKATAKKGKNTSRMKRQRIYPKTRYK